MDKDFGIEIKFASMGQSFLSDVLQFFEFYKTVLNKKNDIVEIGIETAIQFAECNAVRIGNVDFQVPKQPDADIALIASCRQRDEAFDRTGSTRMLSSRAICMMVRCNSFGFTSSPTKSTSMVRRGLPSRASALPPTRSKRDAGGTRSPSVFNME